MIFTPADLKSVDALFVKNGSIPARLLRLVQHFVDASLPSKAIGLGDFQVNHLLIHEL
jgi:hypothetical protein